MSCQKPCRHHPNSPFTSSLVMREKRFAASLSPPASPLPGKGRPCTTQPPLSWAILCPASDGAQGGCNGGLRPTGSQRESALCIKRGSGYSPPGGLAKREAFAPKGAMIGRHVLALIHPAIRQGSVSNKSTWLSHGFSPVAQYKVAHRAHGVPPCTKTTVKTWGYPRVRILSRYRHRMAE